MSLKRLITTHSWMLKMGCGVVLAHAPRSQNIRRTCISKSFLEMNLMILTMTTTMKGMSVVDYMIIIATIVAHYMIT
jgi:hypothetical protein